jgi:hypothetical protein
MLEPIVYKTKHCAILAIHFTRKKRGEIDSGGRGGAYTLGKAIGGSYKGGRPMRDILEEKSIVIADACNALMEEGWIPQSSGFSGAGVGREKPSQDYIFIQLFTKPKE